MEKIKKVPFVTITIIVINILFFLVLEFVGDTENSEFMYAMGAIYPPNVVAGEYWRLISAMFLHFGINHILNNMIMLGATGYILENAMGHIKYLILYFAAGIGGGALSVFCMISSEDYAVTAGASGAIFGIIGGLCWVVLVHKGRYEELTTRGMIIIVVLTLLYGITNSGVDNWGHVGGLLTGLVMAIIMYRKKPADIDFDNDNLYT